MNEMETAQLTPALLVGALLALLLEIVPGLKTWWTALTPERKQGFNLLFVFCGDNSICIAAGSVCRRAITARMELVGLNR